MVLKSPGFALKRPSCGNFWHGCWIYPLLYLKPFQCGCTLAMFINFPVTLPEPKPIDHTGGYSAEPKEYLLVGAGKLDSSLPVVHGACVWRAQARCGIDKLQPYHVCTEEAGSRRGLQSCMFCSISPGTRRGSVSKKYRSILTVRIWFLISALSFSTCRHLTLIKNLVGYSMV